MRTIFRFSRNPSHGLESLLGIFLDHCRSVFSSLWGSSISQILPSSGMDGVGRAAQKVVYQVGNLFGDQGFVSRFGMAPSSQTTQTDNHEHSGARWEKAEATVYLDPNISQTFIKSLSGCHWRLGTKQVPLLSSWSQMKKRPMWS